MLKELKDNVSKRIEGHEAGVNEAIILDREKRKNTNFSLVDFAYRYIAPVVFILSASAGYLKLNEEPLSTIFLTTAAVSAILTYKAYKGFLAGSLDGFVNPEETLNRVRFKAKIERENNLNKPDI